MEDNFARCLPEILRHEGNWADHPKDPGGATMKGITIGTYRQWKGRAVTKAELRAISDVEVAAIYKRNYWDRVGGDDLPAGLDLVAFDAAVNSGPARGARWLQTALGVAADGKIGPKTIAAAREADAATAINRALDVRLSFLKGLKTWPTFGKGWSSRVAGVRKVALAMSHVRKTPKTEHEPPVMSKSAPVSDIRPAAIAKETGRAAAGGLAGGGLALAIWALWADAAQAWRDFWLWAFSFIN
jgi:lysozyme family protein